MITDSIAKASIPMPAKDCSKKKRGNRTAAKLKQSKLDARREQWLAQVKKKGCKGEEARPMHVSNEGEKKAMENLPKKPRDEQIEKPVHHNSESDSPSNSPSSNIGSILGSNISGTNFTASSSSSGGSSSSGSFSGSISGEDEDAEEDECLDDWEAIADALAASDDKQEEPKLELPVVNKTHELANREVELPKPKEEHRHVEKVQRAPLSGRAWKPDDAFRPQSLPNLAKQKSFPSGRGHRCVSGGVWARKTVVSAPSSCPICCEDLDLTDSSFHPCVCGFRLCLFCHKRILEEDGRCPGCRKPYECEPVKGEATFRFARSCSMFARS